MTKEEIDSVIDADRLPRFTALPFALGYMDEMRCHFRLLPPDKI